MGSVQQSILGVFCIVAAFVLGHYIRTHPSPTSLEQERQQQAALTPAPQFAIRTSEATAQSVSTKTEPRLPAPSAGFSTTTSMTEAQPIVDSTVVKRVEPIEMHAPPERKIDVPDFSKLAASFENTPLALPRSTNQTPDHASAVASNNGSFYIRPATEHHPRKLLSPEASVPVPQNMASQSIPTQNIAPQNMPPQNTAGQNAFVGSMPEPVAPPQPTDIYQTRERPTSFRKEDFQPRLVSGNNTRRPTGSPVMPEVSRNDVKQTQDQSTRRRISLAPPEPDGSFLAPEVPELDVRIPEFSQSAPVPENRLATYNADHASNEVHSYYDVDMTESSRSVLDRGDFDRSVSNAPKKKPTNRINRRIPFRLNEQGKQELTRIRSRQQQANINLQTDRFSMHTTQAGDTLQNLSTEYYGKPDFYLDIYLANQQTLRNPTVIPAGIQLRIPQYDQ